MTAILLSFIEWGGLHWILFGWTAFWVFVMLIAGFFTLTRIIFFLLPNRILRTINVWKHGWPPEHLDADGDWKPEPESNE